MSEHSILNEILNEIKGTNVLVKSASDKAEHAAIMAEQAQDEIRKMRHILISDDAQSGICFDMKKIKCDLYGNGKEGALDTINKIDGYVKRIAGGAAVIGFIWALIVVFFDRH